VKDRMPVSYLADSVEEHNLKDLDESGAFERFVDSCIVAREHCEDFDLGGWQPQSLSPQLCSGQALGVIEGSKDWGMFLRRSDL